MNIRKSYCLVLGNIAQQELLLISKETSSQKNGYS